MPEEKQEYFFPEINTDTPPSFEPEKPGLKTLNTLGQFIWETVKIVIISLIIILPIRYYVIQPFYVKGASMEPNFYDHEYLIINEISYRFEEPTRGDIVVFHYPKSPADFFIKRIIGLPGEKVRIKNNSIVIYNDKNPDGFVLNESEYLEAGTLTNGDLEVYLEEDEYYVLGDNRVSSLDSRSFGPIKRDDIIGKTWLRGWPFDRIKIFERPEY